MGHTPYAPGKLGDIKYKKNVSLQKLMFKIRDI